jgi:hypothetical protein
MGVPGTLKAHVLYGEDGDDYFVCGCGKRVPEEVMEDGAELDWHHKHVAKALRKLIDAEVSTAKAAAWVEGHLTRQRLGPDECHCSAWSENECACGKYGSNVITVNPYVEVSA